MRKLICTVFMSIATQVSAAPVLECAPNLALIQTDRAVLEFKVEIADSEAERAKGLMFRKNLPVGHGMLFIYEYPRPASFWMRNTLISLDIIFFDETGTIRHIHPKAKPLDETPIPGAVISDPNPERLMVLEIAGGEAARNELAVGQKLAHPALSQNDAALPCEAAVSEKSE